MSNVERISSDLIDDFMKKAVPVDSTYPTLTDKEIDVLDQAKRSNPWWFLFFLKCALIMIERRYKYSKGHHPYFNFADVARRTGDTMEHVFKFYVAIKESRDSVSGSIDMSDESSLDTQMDQVNYKAIQYGAKMGNLTMEDVLAWEGENAE